MRRKAVVTNVSSAIIRRSAASAIESPAPAAGPGRAATIGLSSSAMRSVRDSCFSIKVRMASSRLGGFLGASLPAPLPLSRLEPMPETSPPAQKALPAPVSRIAPQRSSASRVSRTLRSAGVRMSPRAFRFSGLFSVTVATPSSRSQRSSFVPVSIMVISRSPRKPATRAGSGFSLAAVSGGPGRPESSGRRGSRRPASGSCGSDGPVRGRRCSR